MLKMLLRGMEKISHQLDLEFHYSPANYNFELGLPLEAALRSFFLPYFPIRYGFGSGYLVDQNEKISSQCDWIIYDALNCPPLIAKAIGHDGMEWFPYDSAYGAIEVKRHLDEETLGKAIKQISDTKVLVREATNILSIHPFKRIPQKLFHVPDTEKLQQTNAFVSGIYAYSIADNSKFQNAEYLIKYVFSKFDTTSLDLLPELIAVHGRYYIRKCVIHDAEKLGWKFTQFPLSTNGYALIECGNLTTGIFYFDLITQFANMDISATYQSSLITKFFDSHYLKYKNGAVLFPGKAPVAPKKDRKT